MVDIKDTPEFKKCKDHRDYLGKAGNFVNDKTGVIGIYIGTERDPHGVDYALFCPSVVYDGEDKASINTETRQKLSMPLAILRPLATNTLEEWVEGHNKKLQRSLEKSK